MVFRRVGVSLAVAGLIVVGCAKKKEAPPRATFLSKAKLADSVLGSLGTDFKKDANCVQLVELNDGKKTQAIEISDSACNGDAIAANVLATLKLWKEWNGERVLTMGDSIVATENTPVALLSEVKNASPSLYEVSALCGQRLPLFDFVASCKITKRADGGLDKIDFNKEVSLDRWLLVHLQNNHDIREDNKKLAAEIKVAQERQKAIETALDDAEVRIGNDTTDANSLISKLAEIDSQKTLLKARVDELSKQATDMGKDTSAEIQALKKIEDRIAKIRGELIPKFTEEATKGLDAVEKRISDLNETLKTTDAAHSKKVGEMLQAIESVKKTLNDTDAARKALINNEADKAKVEAIDQKTSELRKRIDIIFEDIMSKKYKDAETNVEALRTKLDGVLKQISDVDARFPKATEANKLQTLEKLLQSLKTAEEKFPKVLTEQRIKDLKDAVANLGEIESRFPGVSKDAHFEALTKAVADIAKIEATFPKVLPAERSQALTDAVARIADIEKRFPGVSSDKKFEALAKAASDLGTVEAKYATVLTADRINQLNTATKNIGEIEAHYPGITKDGQFAALTKAVADIATIENKYAATLPAEKAKALTEATANIAAIETRYPGVSKDDRFAVIKRTAESLAYISSQENLLSSRTEEIATMRKNLETVQTVLKGINVEEATKLSKDYGDKVKGIKKQLLELNVDCDRAQLKAKKAALDAKKASGGSTEVSTLEKEIQALEASIAKRVVELGQL
jgi:chromosome segregation ATPase